MTVPQETERRLDVDACRHQFPSLTREIDGRPAVFFDGPAGSQVPQCVIDAISGYLSGYNANTGGVFATSRETEAMHAKALEAAADFIGVDDPAQITFGPSMTTLTFSVSRALGRTWKTGDEVVVTQLDHDANHSPWLIAAKDAGATVRCVRIRPEDGTLDIDDFRTKIGGNTKLVALPAASNALGTLTPVRELVDLAHDAGALVYVDAVHSAPHVLTEVRAWDCDFLACSPYKFFGPHAGLMWGRRHLLETLPVDKLRPSTNELPGRWCSGTEHYENIAGTMAAIDYIAGLGRDDGDEELDRRQALKQAFARIVAHERTLAKRMLVGMRGLPECRVWGITDTERLDRRVPTISFTHERLEPRAICERLAARGIFAWHGNFYALPVTEALELEPDGLVRIGLLHYNTSGEVDRLLEALGEL